MNGYLLAAAFALGALAAFTFQGYRYGAQISNIKAEQAGALSRAHMANQEITALLNIADRRTIEALTDAKKENEVLRREYTASIAASNKRLRVKATCVPDASTPSGVGDGGTAELSTETGHAVFDLRGQLIELEAKNEALRRYAERVSGTR